MERLATPTSSPSFPSSSLKPLSPQEWETLIDDYQKGRLQRWASSNYTDLPLLDLSLSSLLRKDISLNLKLYLILFLEESAPSFLLPSSFPHALPRLLNVLRIVLLHTSTPLIEPTPTPNSLKEQLMVSTTSLFISLAIPFYGCLDQDSIPQLEGLVEILLSIVNRPNHGPDRQTRSLACECLREVEKAYPCLLSQVSGHLWALAMSERTHASQSYVLLLATVIHGIVIMRKSNASIVNTSSPLIPFNFPHLLPVPDEGSSAKEISSTEVRHLKKAMAFLLEWPLHFTPCGIMELISLIMPIVPVLEVQTSMLKVQFWGLLFTYDLLLCHAVLGLFSLFANAFDGLENEVARRLVVLSKESQNHLVFRLLAVHWLLAFIKFQETGKNRIVDDMSWNFYPNVFDPLALKSLKLDILAYFSIFFEEAVLTKGNVFQDSKTSVEKLFEDGLVSVSAFKWLPPWSTETAVAFRTFHRFLICASSHSDSSSKRILRESCIFHSLQSIFVNLAVSFRSLMPVIVAFINRLLDCQMHQLLGDSLLQTFNDRLLSKLSIDHGMGAYFSLFVRIAKNDSVPPSGLLELLLKFMLTLIVKHGPQTGLKSWSSGSKVLYICRMMLMHHHTSRLFIGLSRLLAFTSLYFPDLEIRDNARTYLRILVCMPGKKLKHVMNDGGQLPGISPSPQSVSFFGIQSPRVSHDLKKSINVSSFIHIDRTGSLLVKQSWSLSLSSLGMNSNMPCYLESTRGDEFTSRQEPEYSNYIQSVSQVGKNYKLQEPLLVTDSKTSEIISTLRQHFSSIPDLRHAPGLKVQISCSLKFKSESLDQLCGVDLPTNSLDEVDALPALYATVLTFSALAAYGTIPSYHIPFLLCELAKCHYSLKQTNVLNEAPVMIELEPREPIPGFVDVHIEANTNRGQTICGQLQSVNIGIEDMFLTAIIPDEVREDAAPYYYVNLFSALWEACGSSSSTARETFYLKGSRSAAAINGTQSIKLLEVPATIFIQSVERYLGRFVVSVIGKSLVNMVRDGGIIRNVIWQDVASDYDLDISTIVANKFNTGPFYLKHVNDEDKRGSGVQISPRSMGRILILIFLPPRFHLLLKLEVCEFSTLVRIRTDHWPCLAYIDDYLESLLSV